MSDAFIIEARGRTAGVAVREKGGFRFFAAATPFYRLDKRVFRGLGALRAALDALASGAGPRPATRQTDQE
jgi:hypothetical protein